MAVPTTTEVSQGTSSRPNVITPLSAEEEDQVILARITNDERALKRVVKKFHAYASLAYAPVVPAFPSNGSSSQTSVEDAREAFLVELATFQLSLKKSAMTCEAEARQVEEYQRECQRIEDEHGTLRGQIEQLKTALEDAQMIRRRKIEYDLVAEKVNTLPSREELELSISALENDMAAIRSEHENQNRVIQGQKTALDAIIAELGSIRLMGKDKDISSSVVPSPRSTPVPDGDGVEPTEEPIDDALPPSEMSQNEEKEEGEDDKPPSERIPSIAAEESMEDDIEMGEVEEENPKFKKKLREELEEGEASDTSSALSDPPDD